MAFEFFPQKQIQSKMPLCTVLVLVHRQTIWNRNLTSTPVIRTGVYPHMPIVVTGPFVTPGFTAVQCIIDFSLFDLGG